MKDDEDGDILASGKKRKRERTNYSEKEMLKDFDHAIGKYASYDDDDSVASEYSNVADDSEDEDDIGEIENEHLKRIAKDVKSSHTKTEERHQWGGASVTDWSKDDVEQVLKCLQSYGYGNIPWNEFLSKQRLPLSKTYKPEELR